MFTRKRTRITAFIGTLGASATLIGMAATSTGAYFTDSEDGSLSGTSGHINVDASGQNLAFTKLMPGEYQEKTVNYNTNSTGKSDVWMVFDQNNAAYKRFTGGGSGDDDSGLGGYGHFAVFNNAGNQLFSSWNLHNESDETSGCANQFGHGSNGRNDDYVYNHRPAGPNDVFCGVPEAIRLNTDLPSGSYQFKVVFGITPKARGFQDTPWAGTVPFKVVATQPGVNPTGELIKDEDKF